YLGQSATPQAVANIRQDLGLNRPITTRYVEWLGNAVQGDFGTSWASKNSVSEQIGKRLGNSLFRAGPQAVSSPPPVTASCGKTVRLLPPGYFPFK
ncbi:hypothetical protein ACC695_38195, partial [Rhizobium ruizarguesonis]